MFFWNAVSIWHHKKEIIPAVAEKDINIVCLWDSNTSWEAIWNDNLRYSNLLQAAIPNSTVINSGVRGENTAMVNSRLNTDLIPYYNSEKRNVATILIWTNDLTQLRTAADTWVDLQTLINNVKMAWFEVVVMTYPPTVWNNVHITDYIAKNDEIRIFNQYIKDNTNLWYSVIDLYSEFVNETDENSVKTWLILTEDPVHFTADWHALVCDVLKNI